MKITQSQPKSVKITENQRNSVKMRESRRKPLKFMKSHENLRKSTKITKFNHRGAESDKPVKALETENPKYQNSKTKAKNSKT